MVKVLVPIANGTEEMEAVIIIDMLRRAGIKVTVAAVEDIVTCSKGVKILPDSDIESLVDEKFDAIILPGGLPGTNNLSENPTLIGILREHKKEGKILGAICAAPTILSDHKLISLENKITSHPSVAKNLANYDYSEDKVVFDDNVITSRGAGTAFEFSLEIIGKLIGIDKAEEIKKAIVLNV